MQSAPNVDVKSLIQSLPTLPKYRLFEIWNEAFGRPAGKLRPEVMLPILAFRIQEKAYGGLSPATKEKLREIAISVSPKRGHQQEARDRFKPGTRLVREWKGTRHEVILTEDGYEYMGEKYKSLSPIACRITGSHWSGPAFFGTRKTGK
jgi:hypothetical protein